MNSLSFSLSLCLSCVSSTHLLPSNALLCYCESFAYPYLCKHNVLHSVVLNLSFHIHQSVCFCALISSFLQLYLSSATVSIVWHLCRHKRTPCFVSYTTDIVCPGCNLERRRNDDAKESSSFVSDDDDNDSQR